MCEPERRGSSQILPDSTVQQYTFTGQVTVQSRVHVEQHRPSSPVPSESNGTWRRHSQHVDTSQLSIFAVLSRPKDSIAGPDKNERLLIFSVNGLPPALAVLIIFLCHLGGVKDDHGLEEVWLSVLKVGTVHVFFGVEHLFDSLVFLTGYVHSIRRWRTRSYSLVFSNKHTQHGPCKGMYSRYRYIIHRYPTLVHTSPGGCSDTSKLNTNLQSPYRLNLVLCWPALHFCGFCGGPQQIPLGQSPASGLFMNIMNSPSIV